MLMICPRSWAARCSSPRGSASRERRPICCRSTSGTIYPKDSLPLTRCCVTLSLPLSLSLCRRCGYEEGSDGQMLHVLTDPAVVSVDSVASGWTVDSLLQRVATAEPRAAVEPRAGAAEPRAAAAELCAAAAARRRAQSRFRRHHSRRATRRRCRGRVHVDREPERQSHTGGNYEDRGRQNDGAGGGDG